MNVKVVGKFSGSTNHIESQLDVLKASYAIGMICVAAEPTKKFNANKLMTLIFKYHL